MLKEIDAAILGALDMIRSGGVAPSESLKKAGLEIIKADPGYITLVNTLEKGSDADLEKAKLDIQKNLLAAFRKPLLEAVKAFPYPKGGRPRLLSDDDKSKACDQIGDLIRTSGLDARGAVEKIASRFGVRLRTMQRVWQGRASYSKK